MHFYRLLETVAWLMTVVVAACPRFGQHQFHGRAALEHLIGPRGTWKQLDHIRYEEEYYSSGEFVSACPALLTHPANQAVLLEKAAVRVDGRVFTARDANCLLLSDFDNNGKVVQHPPPNSFAFVEHVGLDRNGIQASAPLFLTWFDDNFVAATMMQAYEEGFLPWGLHTSPEQSRWAVLQGSPFDPFPNAMSTSYIDRIGQHALALLNQGHFVQAYDCFERMVAVAKPVYDPAMHWFNYTGVTDVYHLAMMKIVGQRLFGQFEFHSIVQHLSSLHAKLIVIQARDKNGTLLGWTTSLDQASNSLINTETTALVVLALCTNADVCIESVSMRVTDGFVVRPYAVVSAVVGTTPPHSHIVSGAVNVALAVGQLYDVVFLLRGTSCTREVKNAVTAAAILEVHDGTVPLAVQTVPIDALCGASHDMMVWSAITVPSIHVNQPTNRLELGISWTGVVGLDVGRMYIQRASIKDPPRVVAVDAQPRAPTWRLS